MATLSQVLLCNLILENKSISRWAVVVCFARRTSNALWRAALIILHQDSCGVVRLSQLNQQQRQLELSLSELCYVRLMLTKTQRLELSKFALSDTRDHSIISLLPRSSLALRNCLNFSSTALCGSSRWQHQQQHCPSPLNLDRYALWKTLPTSTIICRTINISVWLETLIYHPSFGLRIRSITLHCQATYINHTRFFSSMIFSVYSITYIKF